jgi:hypothetical protein
MAALAISSIQVRVLPHCLKVERCNELLEKMPCVLCLEQTGYVRGMPAGSSARCRSRVEVELGRYGSELQPAGAQADHAFQHGYAEMLASGLTAATVRKVHAILSSAYQIEVKRGNVARNLCELVEPPRLPQAQKKALTAGCYSDGGTRGRAGCHPGRRPLASVAQPRRSR